MRDRYGNTLSTTQAPAVAAYDRAGDLLAAYRGDPLAAADEALREDPEFVMAYCLKAGIFATSSERQAEPLLRAAVEGAESHLRQANPRERAHTAAARAWLDRRYREAAARYGEIAAEHPRDLLALQFAHLCDFLLGQSNLLRDRPAQALRAWRAGEHGRGFVLGMHAFGLEECGDYPRAELAGRAAVDSNPADGWAAHAVAHVMEMQGRTSEGIDWLAATSNGWGDGCFFAYHNWWHLALYHLERGDFDTVLRLYDTRVRANDSRVVMELVDASALLWRLRLRGADVGQRWRPVADAWLEVAEDAHYPFNDVHALMAYLADERSDAIARSLTTMGAKAGGSDEAAAMNRDVALPIAQALIDFEQGRHASTIERLSQVRGIAQRFGGSHAQRDILHLTLTESALRAGRHGLASALVAERLALKPHSPFARGLRTRIESHERRRESAVG